MANLVIRPTETPPLSFQTDGGREVFRIEPRGRLIAGEGLSDDEATRELFAVMVRAFPELMRALAASARC